jgi:cytoskeleton protein RodZ
VKGTLPAPAGEAGTDLEFVDDRGRRPAWDTPPDARAVAAVAKATAKPAAAAAVRRDGPKPQDEAGTPDAGTPPGPTSDAAAPAAAEAVPAAPTPADPEPVETLGELLSAAREARGLTIEEASGRTRISAPMLRHLENDRFSEFAAEAYVRGFLRNYGMFLGLDVNMLLRRYEGLAGRRVEPAPDVWDEVVETPPPARPRRLPARPFVVAACVAAVGLAGYGLVRFASDRSRFDLRPAGGLQQIEEELRDAKAASDVEVHPAETPAAPDAAAAAAPAASRPATSTPVAPEVEPQAGAPATGSPVSPAATNPVVASPAASPAVPARAPAVGPATVEDTAPPVGRITDLVEARPASARLILTATALDTCMLRLQVDANARQAQRYTFTRRGESRTWTARRSFRLLAKQSANLELRLNGKLIPVPPDGRTVVLNASTLEAPKPAAARRGGATPARTTKRTVRPRPAAAAPAPATPAPPPQNAAGPPR